MENVTELPWAWYTRSSTDRDGKLLDLVMTRMVRLPNDAKMEPMAKVVIGTDGYPRLSRKAHAKLA